METTYTKPDLRSRFPLFWAMLAMGAALAASPVVCAQWEFYGTNDHGAKQMAIGDFDVDGYPDVAIACGGALVVLFNAGDGTYLPAIEYDQFGWQSVQVADFNGDLIPDIATSALHRMELGIFINDGTGSFDLAQHEYLHKEVYGMNVGDFDGDDDMDIALLNCFADNCDLDWYRNDGTGHFTLASRTSLIPSAISQASHLDACDIDDDGDCDLIAETRLGYLGRYDFAVTIFRNDGQGDAWSITSHDIGPIETEFFPRLTTGDFDNDGDTDIVFHQRDETGQFIIGSTLLNVGSGNFDRGPDVFTLPLNAHQGRLGTGDIDADGDLDVISTVTNENLARTETRVFFNKGDMRFSNQATIIESLDRQVRSVFLDDVDGDGMRDLLLAIHHPEQGMLVMRNQVNVQRPVLEVDPLVRGTHVEFRVSNVEQGSLVHFLYSLKKPGNSNGMPQLGRMTIDLIEPIRLGVAVADANGVARVAGTIPAWAPRTTVSLQAVMRNGVGGRKSVKSNFITRPIID